MATTKTAAHTPGPWTIEEIDERSARDLHIETPAFWVVGDQATSDEVVACVEQVSRERAHADAQLIAAAPDLLEVARIEHELQMSGYSRATARRLGPEAEDAFLSGGSSGLNNWRRVKREAAIAKAEDGAAL